MKQAANRRRADSPATPNRQRNRHALVSQSTQARRWVAIACGDADVSFREWSPHRLMRTAESRWRCSKKALAVWNVSSSTFWECESERREEAILSCLEEERGGERTREPSAMVNPRRKKQASREANGRLAVPFRGSLLRRSFARRRVFGWRRAWRVGRGNSKREEGSPAKFRRGPAKRRLTRHQGSWQKLVTWLLTEQGLALKLAGPVEGRANATGSARGQTAAGTPGDVKRQ